MKKKKTFIEREEGNYNIKEHIISSLILGFALVIIVVIIAVILSVI